MKDMEAKLREVQEKEQQTSDKITALPLVERMKTILAQKQSYVEVKKMRDP